MANNSGCLKIKKIVIAFLVLSLVCCNFLNLGKNIFKGFISYALDDSELPLEAKVEEKLVTNALVKVNNENKKIIQYKVITGIEAKEHPIKTTNMRLRTNIIDGYSLEDVRISKINKNSYTSGEWTLENGEINIVLENEAESLTEKEQGLDELLVTYIYEIDEDLLMQTDETEEDILNVVEEIEITTYSNDSIIKAQLTTTNKKVCIEEPFVKLGIVSDDIHKTTIEDKTDFTELLNIDFKYMVDDLGSIEIVDELNLFLNNKNQELDDNTSVVYKKTVFNKEDLVALLGLNGVLEIKNDEKVLAQISKEKIETLELDVKTEQEFNIETEEDNQEEAVEETEKEIRSYITITEKNVEVEYEEEIENIKISISNINAEEEGKLEVSNLNIENTKTILNVKNIDSLSYLKTIKKCILGEEEQEVEDIINFKDTITRAYLEIDNNEWTSGNANTVKYSIVLDTTSEKWEAFVNPMFILELPDGVESVDRDNCELTMQNGQDIFTEQNVLISPLLEKEYIIIKLVGEQTKDLAMNENIILNLKLCLNIKNDVQEEQETKLYYRNNTITAYENGESFGTSMLKINFINIEEIVPADNVYEETQELEENTNNNDNTYNNEEIVNNEIESNNNIEDQTIIGDEGFSLTINTSEDTVKVGDEFWADLYINNYNYTDQANVVIEYKIPKELEVLETNLYNHNVQTCGYTDEVDLNNGLVSFNEETRVLTVNLDTFKAATKNETDTKITIFETSKLLKIKLKVLPLEANTYGATVNNEIKIINGEETITEFFDIKVLSSHIEIETKKIEDDEENDRVVFEIDVKNLGFIEEGNAEVNFVLPDEYIPDFISSENYGFSTKDRTLKMSLTIPAQSTYTILFYGTHKKSEDNIEPEQAENSEDTTNIINSIFNNIVTSVSNNSLNYNTITSIFKSLSKGGMLNEKV